MTELYRHEAGPAGEATVALDPDRRGDAPVDPRLYGKFSEHLAWNIDHGMEAQLLYNPTFGRWRFRASNATQDGGFVGSQDPDRISAQIAEHAEQRDYPGTERLESAVEDGLSFWWFRAGDEDSVTVSPDVGPHRERAQRVEIETGGDPTGVMQWLYLPLQRTREYEYEATLRARTDTTATVRLALWTVDEDGTRETELDGVDVSLDDGWTTVEGDLSVPEDADVGTEELVAFAVTAEEDCDLVLDRTLLYPEDHVNHADPDVIEFFRDSELPLLRWPGGNFVSDYDWRDGVGPKEERPTKNNPAWGGAEPNLFGTAEFIEFCEAVGCEPLICVNAGTGTPEEAAAWLEYCNGSTDTEMGALRAEHGHPEPFDVQYWEIGNELYGQWQPNWTTKDGYVDRYKRFRDALLEVDDSIDVLACGNLGEWDDHLVAETDADELRSITDHQLAGGFLDDDVDTTELYHAFMGYTAQMDADYGDLVDTMRDAGIEDPHFAITELQLTPTLRSYGTSSVLTPPWRGSRHHPSSAELPGKKTVAEPIWDASIIHDCIRTEGAAELVTHSAAVNHGGGLQKRKERVWADPCHYGHAMGAALFDKTPVGVDVTCDTVSTEESFWNIDPVDDFPVLDALAAVDDDELAVLLVHRGSGVGDAETTLDIGGAAPDGEATVTTLSADTMHEENTLDDPENVSPETTTASVADGELAVTVPEYGLVQVVVPR